MNLTQEMLETYVNGQIQTENSDMDCLYRGQISELRLVGEGDAQELYVTLVWMAQWTGSRWNFVNQPEHTVRLMDFDCFDLVADSFTMSSTTTCSEIVLFSRESRKLIDPSHVHYLSERQSA